jgi:hypothetical protein
MTRAESSSGFLSRKGGLTWAPFCFRRWLTEAHARATAVLVDELDSSRLESVTDLDHELAKSELKALMPEDAKEACGQVLGRSVPSLAQSASIFSRRGRGAIQQSSQTIGATAAAVATAQTELAN